MVVGKSTKNVVENKIVLQRQGSYRLYTTESGIDLDASVSSALADQSAD